MAAYGADILPIDPILHRKCCFRQGEMPILTGRSSAFAQLGARSTIGRFSDGSKCDRYRWPVPSWSVKIPVQFSMV
jgi:hypothetical protein